MSVSPGAGQKHGGNPDIDQHSSGYRSEARFRTTYKAKIKYNVRKKSFASQFVKTFLPVSNKKF
jgi:hypothetical protein